MPKHTVGVLIMGILAIVAFGGVAMCGAKLNPRIVLAHAAQKTLGVEVTAAEVRGSTLEITAAATDRPAVGRDLARLAHAVFCEQRNEYKVPKRTLSAIAVTLGEGAKETFLAADVRRYGYYAGILANVRARLAEQLGLEGPEALEVREQPQGFGVWVAGSPPGRDPP